MKIVLAAPVDGGTGSGLRGMSVGASGALGIRQPNTKYIYVWKSPNGFINQTDSWIDGYVTGFCKIAGPDTGMDEDEADFDCNKGPSSAGWMIGPTVRSGGIDFHRDPKLQVTNK